MQALEFQDCISQIAALCANASAAILSFYGHQDHMGIVIKDDKSPLTQADLAADRILNEGLVKIASIPVVSEENLSSQNQSFEDYWLIDPIDGTKEFIRQSDQFCIAIARIYRHRPILGLIFSPTQRCYWYAGAGMGTYKVSPNQAPQRLHCRRFNPAEPRLLTAGINVSKRVHHFLQSQFGEYRHVSQASALKFCRMAEGDADFYVKLSLGGSEWDIAAGDILLSEAGGGLRYFPQLAAIEYGAREHLQNPPFLAYGAGFDDSRITAYFQAMQALFATEQQTSRTASPFF